MNAVKKYRPYFTLAELQTINGLLQSSNPHSQLARYMRGFVLNVDNGCMEPAIETGLKLDIEQKLGFAERPKIVQSAFDTEQERRWMAGEMSEEEEREYLKSKGLDPDFGVPA